MISKWKNLPSARCRGAGEGWYENPGENPENPEILEETAGEIGEQVNKALNLYERLAELGLDKHEDVAAALETVYAVYKAVLAAEEIVSAVYTEGETNTGHNSDLDGVIVIRDQEGISYPNEDGLVEMPEGGSVKLLYKITVDGVSTSYAITEEGVLLAIRAVRRGYWS